MAFTKIRKVKSTKAMVSILVVSIFLLSGLALSLHTDLTGSVSGQPGHMGLTPSQEFANLTPVTSYVPPDQAYGITGSTIHPNNTVMGNMQIVVGFQPSNIKQLREYINLTENPQSSMYGKFLTRGEFDSLFSANKSAYSSMITYLHRFGVSSITTFADRLSLSFNATSTQASEIFNVSFATYTSGNVLYHAPVSNPELPVSIEGSVSGINGLSNYSLNVIHDAGLSYGMEQTLNGASNQSVSGYPAPQTINGAQFVYGSDMQVAYGEQGLFKNYGYPTHSVEATILWSGQYSGQTIKTPYGNITDGSYVGPYVPSNIYAYYNQTLPSGEPHSKVYGVPLGGSPPPGPKASYSTNGANMENTLDLEMMGSTAPGSSIYNVYSNSSSIASLDNAFSFILNPSSTYSALNNVSVISNSWGGSDGNSSIWYNDLMEAQARGITVLASSGDAGDNPSSRMWLGTNTEFPSSLAYNSFGMVAVGGTTVLLNSGLGISNQTNWYITPSAGGPDGTSSGISIFPEPSWQLSTSANQVIGGKGRAVPDVSALANNTLVTVSVNNVVHSYGFWGTSIASPIVGGIIASIDSVLYMKEKTKLGFADPVLYKLGNTQYSSTSEAMKPFYPVQYGENNVYHDRYGYSVLNGWGTINAYNLTEQLLNKVTAATTYYKSTFTESNLPSGTPWFVNISGVPGSGKITGSSYSTTLKNGTYSYTVSTSSSQYYPSASTGSFTVSGKDSFVGIVFQKTIYNGTLSGIVYPGNSSITANNIVIHTVNGRFNQSLKDGSYNVSVSAYNYHPEFFRVNITDKHVVYVNISLSPLNSTYLINGYVSPSSASISFGEKNVSVNGSGYYNVWLAKGNYSVSVVHSGYTPLISNITVTGNVTGLNFTLVKQPVLTQKITISNITVIGYNVTVKNLTAHNGNISVSFNASTNGTLIISIPFSKLGNINASELHSSLVYISGQKYGDFQIAFSSGNGSKSVLLIVKNLSGDPTLYWIYTPLNAGSHTISVRNSKLMLSSEILIAGLLVFMGILVAYVRRGNRKH